MILRTIEETILNRGEIKKKGCDCPYDFGPICKHQAAVFYALSDIVDNRQSQGVEIEWVFQQNFLTEALDRLTKEQLITIIIDWRYYLMDFSEM